MSCYKAVVVASFVAGSVAVGTAGATSLPPISNVYVDTYGGKNGTSFDFYGRTDSDSLLLGKNSTTVAGSLSQSSYAAKNTFARYDDYSKANVSVTLGGFDNNTGSTRQSLVYATNSTGVGNGIGVDATPAGDGALMDAGNRIEMKFSTNVFLNAVQLESADGANDRFQILRTYGGGTQAITIGAADWDLYATGGASVAGVKVSRYLAGNNRLYNFDLTGLNWGKSDSFAIMAAVDCPEPNFRVAGFAISLIPEPTTSALFLGALSIFGLRLRKGRDRAGAA